MGMYQVNYLYKVGTVGMLVYFLWAGLYLRRFRPLAAIKLSRFLNVPINPYGPKGSWELPENSSWQLQVTILLVDTFLLLLAFLGPITVIILILYLGEYL